jgi:crotonobetainyl-CoA:carnitine CoA-transferase CaiB-like acyl-CoA transferase
VSVLGRSALKSDSFATNALRLENRRALDVAIGEATVECDRRELADRLAEARVIAAAVLRLDEVQDDAHIAARRIMEDVSHPEVGIRKYPRLPLTVDGEPQWSARPTPLFAQHNREIFSELLGLSDEELAGLYQRDVIGDLPKEALRR